MDKNFHENDKKFYTGGTEKKSMPIPKYPNVRILFNEDIELGYYSGKVIRYEVATMLRKKHEDLWYGCTVRDGGIIPITEKRIQEEMISQALTRFHTNVYLFQLYGKINPNLTDRWGEPVYPILYDQREEHERLKEQFRFPFNAFRFD